MAATCVFCRIIAGDEPASIVLERERVLAFMDIRQFHPGHVLVVPKDHVDDIYALDDVALAGGAFYTAVGRRPFATGTA